MKQPKELDNVAKNLECVCLPVAKGFMRMQTIPRAATKEEVRHKSFFLMLAGGESGAPTRGSPTRL